jgi:hypothetical protein
MLPSVSMTGVSLNITKSIENFRCNNADNIFFHFLYFSSSKEERAAYQKTIKNCLVPTKSSIDLEQFLQVDLKKIQSEIFLVHLLKRLGHTDKFIEEIKGVYQIKKRLRQKSKAIDAFINEVEVSTKEEENNKKTGLILEGLFGGTKGRVSPKTMRYLELQKYLNELKEEDVLLVRHLFELSLSLNFKNASWSKQIITKLLKFNPYKIIFDMQKEYFKNEQQEIDFYKAIQRIVSRVEKKIKDERLVKLFKSYLLVIDTEERLVDLRKNFDGLSLLELRELGKTFLFAREHFGAIYLLSIKRFSNNEIQTLIKTHIDKLYIKKKFEDISWIFVNTHTELQSTEVDVSYKSNKDNIYDQYIKLRLNERADLKTKGNSPSSMDIRRFFKSSLLKGKSIRFSIYNLLLLGDEDPIYFWWYFL